VKDILLSLLTGALVGFLFALFKLPIPAPSAMAGIAGIFGIFFGYKLFEWVVTFFKQ
jgi:XapX domain-containing protein